MVISPEIQLSGDPPSLSDGKEYLLGDDEVELSSLFGTSSVVNELEAKACSISTSSALEQLVVGADLTPLERISLGIVALRLFLRLNATGPPLTEQESQSLPHLFHFGQFSPTDNSNELISQIKTALGVDGELLQDFVHVPSALLIARTAFTHVGLAYPTLAIWRSRYALCHQRSLAGGRRHPVQSLKEMAVMGLKEFLDGEAATELPCGVRQKLQLELASAYATYGMTEEFKSVVQKFPFRGELSGRLGFKRQHQQDALAQLVVEIVGDSTHINGQPSAPPPNPSGSPELETTVAEVKLMDLDCDTDVLEAPRFLDDEKKSADDGAPLPLEQRIYLLSWSNLILETTSSSDELARNVVTAILRECLRMAPEKVQEDSSGPSEAEQGHEEKQESKEWSRRVCTEWLTFSYALWLRSRAEFERTKWRERSCLQMLSLEDQYRDPSPSAAERLRHIWALDFPNIWEMKYEVGRRFVQIGSVLTAKKMFEEMKMYDECVQCLAVAGRRNEALEFVQASMEKSGKTPALLCSLADLRNDPKPYEEAWTLSHHRYARAPRSLGRHYFENGDLNKAAEWFKLSLTLQPLQPRTQFTYGCTLMRLGRMTEALNAFKTVVRLEADQGEAWANMASIHAHSNNWDAAKRCIQNAVRESPIASIGAGGSSTWRMWDTYLKIAIKTDDLYAALDALERMVGFNQSESIETWMLNYLVRSVLKKADELQGRLDKVEGKPDLKESHHTAFQHLLERSLLLFKNYALAYSFPLPSSGRSTEAIERCVDRYQVWGLLTDLAQLKNDTFEIKNKQLRHLSRVFEDICHHGYADLASSLDKLLKVLVNTLNELISSWNALEDEQKRLKKSDLARFIDNVHERLREAIKNSSHLSDTDDRTALSTSLTKILEKITSYVHAF